MVNPVTVNLGIVVPLTGADVDTWGEDDVNPNMVALDGLIGGVQTIGVTNVPVTLTAPAGFTATPSPGPTQSQNRVLRFTGTLTGNVRITLPLPGAYLIDNRTTGAFVLSFQGVTATEVVGVDQGSIVEIYNDGANVRFVNLGKVGALEFFGGENGLPAWVTACTVLPYVIANGTVLNFSDYPWLGAKYLAKFGGNGVTTFGIPDMQGRVPLAYDGTGARITTALCGINGQTMGAAGGIAGSTLLTTNLPPYIPSGSIVNGAISINGGAAYGGTLSGNVGTGSDFNVPRGFLNLAATQGTSTFTGFAQGGASTIFSNVPPAQVAGIWVIKT